MVELAVRTEYNVMYEGKEYLLCMGVVKSWAMSDVFNKVPYTVPWTGTHLWPLLWDEETKQYGLMSDILDWLTGAQIAECLRLGDVICDKYVEAKRYHEAKANNN